MISKKTFLLVLFILLKFVMQHFLINSSYDLHRDEYLHLDQANHLAWGYESVPPFTAWISYLILKLGNAVFWVKFFPALFGACTIIVVWKTIETLNGGLFALCLGAIAVSFSVLPRINILYQPNSFDILSWTFLFYTLICYIKTRHSKWLYIAAISFSLGFLNKYNIAFLIAALLPAILFTNARILFLNKHLYFSMALSLLLVAPNLVWQYHHNFPVIHHMKELAETQLVNVQRTDFLKEQLLYFFNSIFLLILAFVAFFTYPPFKKYRFIFWCYVFTITIFLCLKGKPYYVIGVYPVLLGFGAVYLELLTRNDRKKWLRPVTILIPLILFVPAIKKMFPVVSPADIAAESKKSGMHRWEDGKEYLLPQDYADMLGWRELAEKTDNAYRSLNDKNHTLILCDNYGQAGAINYYSRQDIHAVSLNADYINWFILDSAILHVVSIKEKADDLSREKNLFDSVTLTGKVENKYARENGTVIFVLSSPKVNINELLRQEIKKRKVY